MTRLLLPLVLVVAAGVIFYTLAQPVLQQIGELRTEAARLELGLTNARELKRVRGALLKTSNDFSESDLDRLNKMLPDNVDNVRLIIDINNLARGSGMTIRNVKIKTEEGATGQEVIAESGQKKGAVTLSFAVSGSYANFEDFLSRLARSLRLVDVVAVSFSGNERNFYDYNVEIQTYWLK